MPSHTFKKPISLGCIFLVATLFSSITNASKPSDTTASYTGCDQSILSLVTGAQDCEISNQFQDFTNTSPLTVNLSDGFFGITDWLFGETIFEINAKSGDYDFNSFAQNNWKDVMLVFSKEGGDTNMVGYLLTDLNGDWQSPFRDNDKTGNNIKKVSQVSLYYRLDQNVILDESSETQRTLLRAASVPEPSEWALLWMGFMSMVFSMKFKKPPKCH